MQYRENQYRYCFLIQTILLKTKVSASTKLFSESHYRKGSDASFALSECSEIFYCHDNSDPVFSF